MITDSMDQPVQVGDKFRFTGRWGSVIPNMLTQGHATVLEITPQGTVVYQHSCLDEPRRVSGNVFGHCARLWVG